MCGLRSVRLWLGLAFVVVIGQVVHAQDDTLRRNAKEKTSKLNEYSRYTSAFTKNMDGRRRNLEKKADEIEGYDPTDSNYAGWESWYSKQRSKYYADRANQDTAMIRFRDLAVTSERFLHDNEGKLRNLGVYTSLSKAVESAKGWIRWHDTKWDGRYAYPRALSPRNLGAPDDVRGVPVVEAEYVEVPPDVMDVDRWYPLRVVFLNNSSHWIYVRVTVHSASADCEIGKPNPMKFWIAPKSGGTPGRTSPALWYMRITRGGASVEATVTRQVIAYQ
ncbi:MAG: hypothetical protein RIC55_11650 [Pirellulaceae bacterium]